MFKEKYFKKNVKKNWSNQFGRKDRDLKSCRPKIGSKKIDIDSIHFFHLDQTLNTHN